MVVRSGPIPTTTQQSAATPGSDCPRVLFLSLNPIDDFLGYSIRPAEIMMALARKGMEVHLLSPFSSTLPSVESHSFRMSSLARLGITRLAYVSARRLAKSNGLSRLLMNERMIRRLCRSLAGNARPVVKKIDPDLIVGEQDVAAMASILLGEELDFPIVGDLHDVWPLEETLAGRIREGDAAWEALADLGREVVSRADRVMLVGREMRRALEHTLSQNVHNGILVPNAGSKRDARRRPRTLQGVIYAGSLERWECVDLAVGAMARVRDGNSIRFSVVGSGDQARHLSRMAEQEGLPGVIMGPVPRQQVFQIMARHDVGVISTNKPYAKPIKLFDYMSVGLPVVSVEGSWCDIIEEEGVGMICCHDSVSMAEAIETMLFGGVDLDSMGNRAISCVEQKHNWDAATDTLAREIRRLVG